MPFTPSWEPGALLDLADLWTYAPNQAAVTLAADQIDEDLQRDPFDRAEDRGAYRCRKHPRCWCCSRFLSTIAACVSSTFSAIRE
jgi:hypothetical protein